MTAHTAFDKGVAHMGLPSARRSRDTPGELEASAQSHVRTSTSSPDSSLNSRPFAQQRQHGRGAYSVVLLAGALM